MKDNLITELQKKQVQRDLERIEIGLFEKFMERLEFDVIEFKRTSDILLCAFQWNEINGKFFNKQYEYWNDIHDKLEHLGL